jgi:hypothetical protein
MKHLCRERDKVVAVSFTLDSGLTRIGTSAALPISISGMCKCAAIAVTSLLLAVSSAPATAQQLVAEHVVSTRELPDAPTPQTSVYQVPTTAASLDGSAIISGTVLDGTGAAIAGAQVSLLLKGGRRLQTLTSGTNGDFAFTGLPSGPYLVRVEAPGFTPYLSTDLSVTNQQTYVVPAITLSVAGTSTEVTVRPTDVIAAEQIKAEEKQRVLGLVPNFYVSYIPDAAPLNTKQKFSLAAHDTLDWSTFIGVSVAAGLEQANNTYPGYGQGAAGYGKRWGAQFADGRTSDLLSHAVFASLFHQDPRYFYQGTGTKKSRLYHALGSAFIARSDSGHRMPNYSYLLGETVSGAISNAYYPASDRGAGLVFTTAAIGIAGRAGQAVIQEFIGKRATRNVPSNTPIAPPANATKHY